MPPSASGIAVVIPTNNEAAANDDGEIGRPRISDGGEKAEHHQNRAVALERNHAAFRLCQRIAERDRAGEAHAAEHVEILWAVTGGDQAENPTAGGGPKKSHTSP